MNLQFGTPQLRVIASVVAYIAVPVSRNVLATEIKGKVTKLTYILLIILNPVRRTYFTL